jgi:glucan phosphoethanolaminetransferase (alkaline phosphatase superfamily)
MALVLNTTLQETRGPMGCHVIIIIIIVIIIIIIIIIIITTTFKQALALA